MVITSSFYPFLFFLFDGSLQIYWNVSNFIISVLVKYDVQIIKAFINKISDPLRLRTGVGNLENLEKCKGE